MEAPTRHVGREAQPGRRPGLLALAALLLCATPAGSLAVPCATRRALRPAAACDGSRVARAWACGRAATRPRAGVRLMAKNKLKKAASAGLDALDLLEAQANAAVAAADAVTAAPTTAATGAPPSELAPLDAAAKGKKGKGKLKAAAAAGLAALDEIEPPPSPPAAAAAVAIAPPPPAPGGASALDELLKAKTLLDAGALTQAEFDALKLLSLIHI